MQIRVGYELIYDCPQPIPMILTLNIHYTRVSDIVVPDHLITNPSVPITAYLDGFGNWCSRIVAPTGQIRLSANAIVNDTGEPDVVAPSAQQNPGARAARGDPGVPVGQPILRNRSAVRGGVGSLREFASRMGARPGHLRFRPQSYRLRYEHARSTKTAWDVFNQRSGVCRDYAHLAIAFCRCMNFPTRYCTGYLGDIGVPPGDPKRLQEVDGISRTASRADRTLRRNCRTQVNVLLSEDRRLGSLRFEMMATKATTAVADFDRSNAVSNNE